MANPNPNPNPNTNTNTNTNQAEETFQEVGEAIDELIQSGRC